MTYGLVVITVYESIVESIIVEKVFSGDVLEDTAVQQVSPIIERFLATGHQTLSQQPIDQLTAREDFSIGMIQVLVKAYSINAISQMTITELTANCHRLCIETAHWWQVNLV